MKKNLLHFSASALSLCMSLQCFAQPNLGTAANFVLFSTNGAVSNTGITHLTGNVGTNNGSSTGFGNVNGVMHDGDGVSAQCAADLLIAYGQLNTAIPTNNPAPLLGNGMTLYAGVNAIAGNATLNLNLILDAQGDPNAVFIFQIQGTFSTNAGSSIELINGALACNIFWKVEGMVSMSSGTSMKGTIVANNSAIEMSTGDILEGRALSTAGAITVDGVLAYTPIGCGSPVLTGPWPPDLGVAACYAIFSTDGAVTNSGITNVTGDVGSNNGAVTGYDPLVVTGTIHLIPDPSTAQCSSDLLVAYNYLNLLPYEIELLYPTQFGNNLVLTPHTYLMNAAATFTDSLYLDAQGNPDAVFVIQINGAMTTSTYSKVLLINGTQAENVYWLIEGAVEINNYSVFNGNIICNNGALGAINTGVVVNGRALTTNGALSTTAFDITASPLPINCSSLSVSEQDASNVAVLIHPNAFSTSITVTAVAASMENPYEFIIYSTLGQEVLYSLLTQASTFLRTDTLPRGVYFYKVQKVDSVIQTGKLLAE